MATLTSPSLSWYAQSAASSMANISGVTGTYRPSPAFSRASSLSLTNRVKRASSSRTRSSHRSSAACPTPRASNSQVEPRALKRRDASSRDIALTLDRGIVRQQRDRGMQRCLRGFGGGGNHAASEQRQQQRAQRRRPPQRRDRGHLPLPVWYNVVVHVFPAPSNLTVEAGSRTWLKRS